MSLYNTVYTYIVCSHLYILYLYLIYMIDQNKNLFIRILIATIIVTMSIMIDDTW